MLDSPKQNDPSRPSPTPTSPGNPNTWDDLNDRSVPPGDIKPPSPEPGETEVRSAMCDLARALLESRFATRPATHSGDSPHRIMVPAWLAYAQDRGHSRPAAEWAIYRLAETGRITLDEPGLYRIYRVRPLPEYASRALEDWASRLRGGRPARVTDWDLFDRPAILRITSEPTLWTWYAAETQQGEGEKRPDAPSAKQLLHGWRAIDEALGLSRSYPNMNYDERRRKLAYLNRRFGGPIKAGGKGRQPVVNRSELIAWWNSLEDQVENQKARIRDTQATLQSRHQYGRTAQVAPDLGGSVKRRKSR